MILLFEGTEFREQSAHRKVSQPLQSDNPSDYGADAHICGILHKGLTVWHYLAEQQIAQII